MGLLDFFKIGEASKSNKSTFNDDEIEILKNLSGKSTNSRFVTENIKEVTKYLKQGMLTYADYTFAISKNTVSKLKSVLENHGLDTRGKKDDLVYRIITNIPQQECMYLFPERYIVLTENAKKIIECKLAESHNKYIEKIKNISSLLKINDVNGVIKIVSDEYIEDLEFKTNTKIQAIFDYRNQFEWNEKIMFIAIHCYLLNANPKNTDILSELGYGTTYEEAHTVWVRLLSLGQIREFKSAGIEKYYISTSHDSKVCRKCMSQNGKFYSVNNAIVGKNAPPLCENCRCVMIPVTKNLNITPNNNKNVKQDTSKIHKKANNENDEIWRTYGNQSMQYFYSNNFKLYRNTRFDMAIFLKTEQKYKDAIARFAEVAFWDLTGCGDNFDYIIFLDKIMPLLFPYESSSMRVSTDVIREIGICQRELKTSDIQLRQALRESVINSTSPVQFFTYDEIVDIIFWERDKNISQLKKVYDKAKKRFDPQNPNILSVKQ